MTSILVAIVGAFICAVALTLFLYAAGYDFSRRKDNR